MSLALAFTVSREALKLIKIGKAVLSSGGVRDLAGRFIELAVPTTQPPRLNLPGFVLGPWGGALNIASSLGSNVQCAFIQKGVNEANVKLDDVIGRLTRMEGAMAGLNTIKALSWVTTGLSLANCGISIAGFCMTMKRLDRVESSIKEFYDRYVQDRTDDLKEQFSNCLLYLRGDLDNLALLAKGETYTREQFKVHEVSFRNHLNETLSFLRKVMDEIAGKRLDEKIGYQMLYTLCPVYAQMLNEYCCQYYYTHHEQHALYGDWLRLLDDVNTPAFREQFQKHLTFTPEYAMVSPIKKNAAYSIVYEGVDEQINRVKAYAEIIPTLPENEYIHIGDKLHNQVYQCLAQAVKETKGEDMDKLVTEAILNSDITETENDVIAIPVTIG